MNRRIQILGLLPLLLVGCSEDLSRFGLTPVTDADYYTVAASDKIDLGQQLFFDKILSGNQNISCATCHHPSTTTSDALSLGVGEGGTGLGMNRTTGGVGDEIVERVPRNSPTLFNIGAKEYVTLFHDGRVELDDSFSSGFRSPAKNNLPSGLDNVLAVQALFPVTSPTEMAGQGGENTQGTAGAASNFPSVWSIIELKLQAIPAYVTLFKSVYGLANASEIKMAHVTNAIGAFEAKFYRSDNAPFDAYLRGDDDALSENALAGAKLFYGKAACVNCHSGVFQTDHKFYNIAIPQFGPGKKDGINDYEDYGREKVSKNYLDRYKFRTPSLRNIALNGPWGHDGAYNSLRGIIVHHLDPAEAFENYDRTQAVLPSRTDLDDEDFDVLDDPTYRTDVLSTAVKVSVALSDTEIDQILSFLNSLTDPNMVDLRADIPTSVPSGLPVVD